VPVYMDITIIISQDEDLTIRTSEGIIRKLRRRRYARYVGDNQDYHSVGGKLWATL
jgi:hypothetical protein